jgi:PAS domain S-box-containing protein
MPPARYRVLLVDGNPGDVRLALAEAAETCLDVRVVETLSAALEALADPADAIILDLDLSDSRGLETLRRIAERSRGVPIIVVSALVDEKIRADARRDGAEEIFSKDDAVGPLFSRIVLCVIERHQARRQHRQLERLLEATPDPILVVGLAGVVRYANQAALSLFDRHREGLVGEPLGFPIKGGEPIKIAIPRRGDQRLCEMQVAPIDWLGEGALLASLRDITPQREAQRELSQLRLLLNGVTDYALGMLDPHGIITSWNTGAQRIYGYAPDEIVGRHFSLLFTEKDRADQVPREVLREAVAAGRSEAKLSRVRKDAVQFLGDVTIDPIYDEDGLLVGFAKVTRDITEQERLAWLQNEFVSVVTHELRTPVTSLLGAIELARSPTFAKNPDKADALIDIALSNAKRLRSLVSDILDSERMRLGSIVVDLQPTDLGEICRHAIADNQPYSRSYRVKIRLENLAGACWVLADKVRMEQLLANLLSNAAKFSKPGGEVLLRIERVEGANVRVSVADRGLGIPKHLQERVFERFFQVDASDKRSNSGTGLGLSIAKAIVEKHNGRIGVTSETGKGATFYFELPETRSTERLASAGC